MHAKADRPNAFQEEISVKLGKIEVGVFLYYIAFLVYAIAVLMLTVNVVDSGYQFVPRAMVFLKFVAFLFLVFKIVVFQRQTAPQWILIASMALLGLLSYMVTDEPTMLAFMLFVAAAKGVDWRILSSIALFVNIFIFLGTVSGCVFGVLKDYVMARAGTFSARHSLGFAHPNSFGLCLASACAAFFALRGKKIGAIDAIVGFICCCVIISVSDSRTSALGVVLAFLLFFAAARIQNRSTQHLFGVLLLVGVAIIVFLSLWLMIFYNGASGWQNTLDGFVSGRFYWAHRYFASNPPGFFGQNTDLLPALYKSGIKGEFVVDNAYARLYLRYGICFATIFIVMLFAFLIHINKYNKIDSIFAGIVFAALYGFGEHMFIRPEFNYFMVIGFSWLLYGFPNPSANSKIESSAAVVY